MIPYKETTNPEAIQKHVIERVIKADRVLLLGDNVKVLEALLSVSKKHYLIPKEKKSALYLFISRWISQLDITCYDNRIIVWLMIIGKSNKYVLIYLWYLKYYMKTHKKKELTIELFCDAFKDGIIKTSSLKSIWRSQTLNKTKSAIENGKYLVQYLSAGTSIL